MHFDEAQYYDYNDRKSKKFANDEKHKKDDELFADFMNILDASKPTFEFNIIPCKSSKTYSYCYELRSLSSFSNISNTMRDEKDHEANDATLEDQLGRETEEQSHFSLIRRDQNLGIQPSNNTPKRSCHDRLTKPTLSN